MVETSPGLPRPPEPMKDEAGVPLYTLPPLLERADGSPVADAEGWRIRRAELLRLFEQTVYGRVPEVDATGVCFKQWSTHEVQLSHPADDPDGDVEADPVRALCRQGELVLPGDAGRSVPVLLYEPADAGGPVPCFIGLNFKGNAAVTDDPAVRTHPDFDESRRGAMKRRWPLARIVGDGFAVMTSWYEAWSPDHPERWREGAAPAPEPGAPDAGGAIALWAWGLRRMLDAASLLPSLDPRRVAVLGHSRLGKAALWAGALDERFALAISNDSGCGGATLSRRCFGETVAQINETFPHWFCLAFHGYGAREADLPVDQHQLLALLAPRPVAVGSAAEDLWADPRGEFLSLVHAGPTYTLHGLTSLNGDTMPDPGGHVHGHNAYHLRPGRHDLLDHDWQRYLAFARRHLSTDP